MLLLIRLAAVARRSMMAFRESRRGPRGWYLAKTLIQTSILWITFFIFIPVTFRRVEMEIGWPQLEFMMSDVVAAVIFVPFGVMALCSGYVIAHYGEGTPFPLDTAKRLVIRGPYRWVRNPMAVAGLLQTAAAGLWFGSWLTQVLVVAGFVAWNYFVRPAEEQDLETRFGSAYRDYRDSVPCWLPRRKPYPVYPPGS